MRSIWIAFCQQWRLIDFDETLDLIVLGLFESEREAREYADAYNREHSEFFSEPFQMARIVRKPFGEWSPADRDDWPAIEPNLELTYHLPDKD